jgi:fructose-1-phosphate kinase PfkB-like protein
VVVDTSGDPLRHALEAAPHVVKPNVHELESLLGYPLRGAASVAAAARQLIAAGVGLAVVSMGAKGACFVTASDALIAQPPAVEVHSTVGAGDAMVAGIVAAQLRALPLEGCARLATAFAVQALTRGPSRGGWRAAVEGIVPAVTVRRVNG